MTFAGPGAGPAVTAATILDDVSEVISGGLNVSPTAAARGNPRAGSASPAAGSWFLRIRGGSLTFEDLAEHLAIHRLPAVRAVRLDGDVLAVRTVHGAWQTLLAAVEVLEGDRRRCRGLPVIESGDANDGGEGNGRI